MSTDLQQHSFILRWLCGLQDVKIQLLNLPEGDQATWAVPPTLLALHPWHQMARLRVILGIKWQDYGSNEEVLQTASPTNRVHPASGAAALGWPHHMDGRHTHAESSLLQWAPRRKAWLRCSKKALQRPAEEKACTGGNQCQSWQEEASYWDAWCSSLGKVGCKSEAERHEATKENAGGRQCEQHPNHSQPKPSPVQSAGHLHKKIRLYSHQRACMNWPSIFPKFSSARSQPSPNITLHNCVN